LKKLCLKGVDEINYSKKKQYGTVKQKIFPTTLCNIAVLSPEMKISSNDMMKKCGCPGKIEK
jgi:hypothetical protein